MPAGVLHLPSTRWSLGPALELLGLRGHNPRPKLVLAKADSREPSQEEGLLSPRCWDRPPPPRPAPPRPAPPPPRPAPPTEGALSSPGATYTFPELSSHLPEQRQKVSLSHTLWPRGPPVSLQSPATAAQVRGDPGGLRATAVYKDLVLPLQKDCLPSSSQLKTKDCRTCLTQVWPSVTPPR
ncbi:hypothetical protein AB1E19_001223 [Capra hircus]